MKDLEKETGIKAQPIRITSWHGRTLTSDSERYSKSRRASVKAGVVQTKIEKKEIKMGKRGVRTITVSHRAPKA